MCLPVFWEHVHTAYHVCPLKQNLFLPFHDHLPEPHTTCVCVIWDPVQSSILAVNLPITVLARVCEYPVDHISSTLAEGGTPTLFGIMCV